MPTRRPFAKRPDAAQAVDRYALERVELPATVKLHELRQSPADELWRVTGDVVLAQKLLRHESVATTQGYLHPRRDGLAAGLRAVANVWREDVDST